RLPALRFRGAVRIRAQELALHRLRQWRREGAVELPDDNKLVFAESAIDGLSYAALHPDQHTRYASIGGAPNPKQPALIAAAIMRMPPARKSSARWIAMQPGAITRRSSVMHPGNRAAGMFPSGFTCPNGRATTGMMCSRIAGSILFLPSGVSL